ncbi:MAG: hypothetical protein ABRQ27_11725 [Clostridiaceae bacterium]
MDTTVRRTNGSTRMKRARNRNSRTYKNHVLRKRKLRLLFIKISFTILIFISCIIIVKTLYFNNRCKDLNYAANYYLTSSSAGEYKLLRVKKLNLLYDDGNTAEAIASGLEDSVPHKSASYKVYFKKSSGGYWLMENISQVKNE